MANQITPQLIKALRERSGAGMMDCKAALVDSDGDIDRAFDELRKKGASKASKKASRTAAEGIVVVKLAEDGKSIAMTEINCETDFVARDQNFQEFAEQVTSVVLQENITDVVKLAQLNLLDNSSTIEAARHALVTKIGENVQLRRVAFLTADEPFGFYVHNSRIAVIVQLQGGDTTLARDIAMHIAASRPEVVNPEDVSEALINKEKEIFKAQAQESGKPDDIIEKMIAGRMKGFINDVSLVGQPFVKDTSRTVGDLLKSANAHVIRFERFEVGEGIEKEETDFVAEVMAQAGMDTRD